MNQYDGAVLYLDLLGIGALTRGQVKLTESDYLAWVVEQDAGHHFFAAKLLQRFRLELIAVSKLYQDAGLRVSQLSDAAFIWSTDAGLVAEAARDLMWRLTMKGVLCRGGLAYGQIIEPDKVNRSLGEFILGDAVTEAVNLEGAGKGCRVFCDTDVAHAVLKRFHFRRDPFHALRNPLDGSVIDEFVWYALPVKIDRYNYTKVEAAEIARAQVELLAALKYSAKFRWNCTSSAALMQIACSIESVSKSLTLSIGSDTLLFNADTISAEASRGAEGQQRVLSDWRKVVERAVSPRSERRGS